MFLGIDGGGTKTEFLLFNEDLKIADRRILSATNPNSVGFDKAVNTLVGGIREITSRYGAPSRIFAGIAGCAAPPVAEKLACAIKAETSLDDIRVRGDISNLAATHVSDHVGVICGTGCAVFLKRGTAVTVSSGWGYLLDEGVCGYTLGRGALRAALAAEDGIRPPSPLCEMIKARFNGSVRSAIPAVYKSGVDGIAALAPIVFRAIDEGDPTARDILAHACGESAAAILAAMPKNALPVWLSGGLTANGEQLLSHLWRLTNCDVRINRIPQIIGAAAEALGAPCDATIERLWQNYKNFTENE